MVASDENLSSKIQNERNTPTPSDKQHKLSQYGELSNKDL